MSVPDGIAPFPTTSSATHGPPPLLLLATEDVAADEAALADDEPPAADEPALDAMPLLEDALAMLDAATAEDDAALLTPPDELVALELELTELLPDELVLVMAVLPSETVSLGAQCPSAAQRSIAGSQSESVLHGDAGSLQAPARSAISHACRRWNCMWGTP